METLEMIYLYVVLMDYAKSFRALHFTFKLVNRSKTFFSWKGTSKLEMFCRRCVFVAHTQGLIKITDGGLHTKKVGFFLLILLRPVIVKHDTSHH